MTERQYKDSGVGWIGDIPNDWEVIKIKYLQDTSQKDSFIDGDWIESPYIIDSGIRYLTSGNIGDGVFKHQGNGYISDKTFEVLNCKYAYPNDLIISRLNAPYGRACILPNDENKYVLAVDNVILRTKQNKPFLCYVMQCDGYHSNVEEKSAGTAMKRISRSKLGHIQLPLPSFEEQQQIADFLDSKTAAIDSAVQAQKDIVEKLNEYKQAVITEAVTKGLDCDADMKDSGIEWIGMIPSNWYTMRIKDVIVRSKDGIKIGPFGSALTGKTVSHGNYYVYSQYNLINDDFSDAKNKITDDTFNTLKAYEVLPNDICLSMMGTIGKCKTVPSNIKRGIMDSHLIKIRLNERMIDKYFEYVYDKDYSGLCYKQMQFDKTGSIMDGLNTTIIKNLYLPVPPLEEQQQIIEYLDSKTATIDKAIEQKNAIIEKLEEYKKSIIYNAVTGKIDCRKDVIPE